MSRVTGRRPRVLVVAYDFPPHAAIGTMRTLRVVRRLADRDFDITVLTGEPTRYLPGTPVDHALLNKVPPGVRVLRAGAVRPWHTLQQTLRSRSNRGVGPARVQTSRSPKTAAMTAIARVKDVLDAALSIPDRESGWLIPALATGLVRQIGALRPDVIYSSAPPWTGQLVAAGLKLALRRPWIADFRDPWSRAPWRGDRYRFAMRAAASLEAVVVRLADRIVFVAAANRDEFAGYYGQPLAARFDVVANGCDSEELDVLRETAVTERERFVLLHAGTLYAGRTPLPLLNALAKAIRSGEIDPRRFVLRFLGANALGENGVSSVCRELGLEGVVEFLPRVVRTRSLEAMVSASALLLLQPGHALAVPAKLYEYLATGRPILAIAEEGEVSTLIRQTGAGIFVTPDDEAGLVAALVSLFKSGNVSTNLPPRESFDGTMRADQIADLVDSIIREEPITARSHEPVALSEGRLRD